MTARFSFIPILLIMASCATTSPETAAYRTIAVTAHTVNTLMENWADASVAGRTTPEIDSRVSLFHMRYSKAASGAKIAVDALRAGTGNADAVTAALTVMAAHKKDLSELILSLVTPQKKAALSKLP